MDFPYFRDSGSDWDSSTFIQSSPFISKESIAELFTQITHWNQFAVSWTLVISADIHSFPALIEASKSVWNKLPTQLIWAKPPGSVKPDIGKNYPVITENIFVWRFGTIANQAWNPVVT
jgi:hypothetical protein